MFLSWLLVFPGGKLMPIKATRVANIAPLWNALCAEKSLELNVMVFLFD